MNTKTKTQVLPVSYPHTGRGQGHAPLPDTPKTDDGSRWLIVWTDNTTSIWPTYLWPADVVRQLKKARRVIYHKAEPTEAEIAAAIAS